MMFVGIVVFMNIVVFFNKEINKCIGVNRILKYVMIKMLNWFMVK